MENGFRFQNLEIWKKGVAVSSSLFKIADALEDKKKFRFAEQLRAAVLSITNNIAEGSGSLSEVDFRNFLNISRRSVFEVASMLMILSKEGYLADSTVSPLLSELEEESKMIAGFISTLNNKLKAKKYRQSDFDR